jgi:hypothetical protein
MSNANSANRMSKQGHPNTDWSISSGIGRNVFFPVAVRRLPQLNQAAIHSFGTRRNASGVDKRELLVIEPSQYSER